MITLDYSTAHTLAHQVVSEAGAEHYDEPTRTGYAYVADGAPRCLVGCVLARAGIDLEALADQEGQHVGVVLNHLARDEQAEATREACGFLAGLQARNDGGLTWGQALTGAATEAKNYAAARAAARSQP
jgi:hypothetical protein